MNRVAETARVLIESIQMTNDLPEPVKTALVVLKGCIDTLELQIDNLENDIRVERH